MSSLVVRFLTLATAMGFFMDEGRLSVLGEGDSSPKVSDSSSDSSSSIVR